MRSLARLLLVVTLAAAGAACSTSQPLDMTDPGIEARIRANLEADRQLDLRYVTISVHSRTATVSGMVPTWSDTLTIRRIVESTKGVEQAMINLITQE